MRKILLSVIILLSASMLNAQVPFSFSVKSGYSFAKQIRDFELTDYGNSDYASALYIGLNFDFFNHDHFSLLAEAGLAVKTYDYLYFSPLFKARWEFGSFIPSVILGPRMDVMVTRDAIIDGSSSNPTPVVWGGLTGLELEYQFFPFGVYLGSQYQYDFTNAFESSNELNPFTWKNSAFMAYLGFKAYFGARPDKNRRGFNYKMF